MKQTTKINIEGLPQEWISLALLVVHYYMYYVGLGIERIFFSLLPFLPLLCPSKFGFHATSYES